jgi:phosphatidate cytidylyltransferase
VALAPVAILIVWLGGSSWSVLVTVIAAGVACEWVALCGGVVRAPPGLLVPLAVTLAGALAAGAAFLAALAVLLAGLVAVRLAGGRRVRRPASLAAGVIYVGLAGVALVFLRHDGATGRANTLFLLTVVWASDVGAYTAGRLLGGPKLAPRISPAKTWAGAAGGLLAAVAAGYALAALLAGDGTTWRIAAVAAFLSIIGQIGDLLESAAKRRFGVKDSGRIIPGHGGLLDRLDGFLTAGPAAALLAVALGRGFVLWQ